MKSTLSDLDQFLGLLLANIRLLPVVFVDHLDRNAAHLAAQMVERKFERVAHVVADDGSRAAEGRDEADLDRSLCCAIAGAAASSNAALAASKVFCMVVLLEGPSGPITLEPLMQRVCGPKVHRIEGACGPSFPTVSRERRPPAEL